jgi:ABC-2 type transport system permease protein
MSANLSGMSGVSGQFQLVNEKGWRRGLGNLLRGEWSLWFNSARWWQHLIVWFLVINGMMGLMVFATAEAAKNGSEGPPLLYMYGWFGAMFGAIGVMIIMQRVLVREKQQGTAAWVLSKPVTRTAFIVSRLVVNSIAVLLTSVIVPSAIFYLTLGLFSDIGWVAPLGYAAGLLMFLLHTFYWVALVLMMGTLVESSSAVIAVPMAVFFGFWFGPSLVSPLVHISPLLLTVSPAPDQFNSLAGSFMTGAPVFSWLPLISTIFSCVAFIAVAIWRFNRQEF